MAVYIHELHYGPSLQVPLLVEIIGHDTTRMRKGAPEDAPLIDAKDILPKKPSILYEMVPLG